MFVVRRSETSEIVSRQVMRPFMVGRLGGWGRSGEAQSSCTILIPHSHPLLQTRLLADPRRKVDFEREYAEQHPTEEWFNTSPRGPCRYSIPPDRPVGHKETMVLSPAHYTKVGPTVLSGWNVWSGLGGLKSGLFLHLWQEGGLPATESTVSLEFVWMANRPKIVYAENFLSGDEVDHFREHLASKVGVRCLRHFQPALGSNRITPTHPHLTNSELLSI